MWNRFLIVLAMLLTAGGPAWAQADNYPDKKALVINTFPGLELSGFTFSNVYKDSRTRFHQDMAWKNVSDKPIAAFEIVILKYDAFDQRMVGNRWVVTGRNSAFWGHLQPGESAYDGLRSLGSEEVMTAIAYVRAARMADGTVWRVNEVELTQKLKAVAPGIREFGSVKPDAKPEAK